MDVKESVVLLLWSDEVACDKNGVTMEESVVSEAVIPSEVVTASVGVIDSGVAWLPVSSLVLVDVAPVVTNDVVSVGDSVRVDSELVVFSELSLDTDTVVGVVEDSV